METIINYYNAVDTLDEGVIALHLFKIHKSFPVELRSELIDILNFLKQANQPEYENLLYDKRIMISKESLASIHENIKVLNFSSDAINTAIELLNKISVPDSLDNDSVILLEKYLLEFSHPLWIATLSKSRNEK